MNTKIEPLNDDKDLTSQECNSVNRSVMYTGVDRHRGDLGLACTSSLLFCRVD